MREATAYVALAEAASGPVPRPVDPAWPWGEALGVLGDLAPDVRLINLETSITRSGDFAPGKQVHYRMNPANIGCLTVARPDVCALANNHVLDFGRRGLAETLDTLAGAGLPVAGAGRDVVTARRAVVAGPASTCFPACPGTPPTR
jgi:poly-gamma-glutamate capsule biosynthesis protein CapA/YwtB (metallophosphatase superfamily)